VRGLSKEPAILVAHIYALTLDSAKQGKSLTSGTSCYPPVKKNITSYFVSDFHQKMIRRAGPSVVSDASKKFANNAITFGTLQKEIREKAEEEIKQVIGEFKKVLLSLKSFRVEDSLLVNFSLIGIHIFAI
jgi:hypothetical protein